MSSIEGLVSELRKFRDARDWQRFHNPKDLAISVSIEAAELLEIFQWSGADLSADGRLELVRDELADVLIYCLLMADATGLDVAEIVREKIRRNESRFPAKRGRRAQ